MRAVAIHNIENWFGPGGMSLHKVNYLSLLMKPAIKIQIIFELTGIEYDRIRDKIQILERIEYNNAIVRNAMNEYDK